MFRPQLLSSSGSDPHNMGWFATGGALEIAHPTGNDGDFAIVGETDTVWVWDSDTNGWIDTGATGTNNHNMLINRDLDDQHPSDSISIDTSSFTLNLSNDDDNVQKALESIDQLIVRDSLNLGYFTTSIALVAAHPTADPGSYAMVGSTSTIWVWSTDSNSWVDSHLNNIGVSALTPVTRNCLMAWNDVDGRYAKNAGNTWANGEIFAKMPHSTNINQYRFRTYACPWTTSYAGIVDLSSYFGHGDDHNYPHSDDYNSTGVGFVANAIVDTQNSEFGGGLVVGHNRIALLVKPKYDGNYEVLVVEDDKIVKTPYGISADGGISIGPGQTYDINGTPHKHDELYLQLDGGTLLGPLDMDGSRITNIGNPVNGDDAVNLDYVSGLLVGIVWQDPVLSIESTPPEVDGRYLVASSGTTGEFASKENNIATRTGGVWTYESPSSGWSICDLETNFTYVWNGSIWAKTSGVINHSSLSNLLEDVHTQYVHTTNARSISALHTFTNGTRPFNVDSTTVVPNLNADKVDGLDSGDLALVDHTHDTSDITDFNLVGISGGQILSWDSTSGKIVPIDNPTNSFVMNPNHQFATTSELDDYFVLHPDELINGVIVAVGTSYYQYDVDEWVERTAILRGVDGLAGADGDSAYEVALDNGFSGNAGEWLLSLKGQKGDKGDTGDDGPMGPPGTSITLKGVVATVGDLPSSGNTVNDAYLVTADSNHIYIWSEELEWVATGLVAGPAGEPGEDGTDGAAGANGSNGSSAYQLAVSQGYTGTLNEWLDSLTGERGPPGNRGPPGESVSWKEPVESIVDEPPTVYDIGDRFIVSNTPTGGSAFEGYAKNIATRLDTSEWYFDEPAAGMVAYVMDESSPYSYIQDNWEKSSFVQFEYVLFYENYAAFPTTGDALKVYVDATTGYLYQWKSSAYSQIGGSTNAGDVIGPSGAVTGNLAALDATGKILSDSGYDPSEFASTGHNHSSTYQPLDSDLTSIAGLDSAGNVGKVVTAKTSGGYELLTVSTTDKLAAVSANDTTPGYLNGKLVAGTGITLTEGTDGGNETLTVALTEAYTGVVSAYTLTATPTAGKQVEIIGIGNLWTVTAAGDAVIQMGADASVANGVLSATNGYDCVTLICISATKWVVKSAFGSFTLV